MKKQSVNPAAPGARVRRGFRKLVDLKTDSHRAQAVLERYLEIRGVQYQRLLGDGFIRYAVKRELWCFTTTALMALIGPETVDAFTLPPQADQK